MKHTQGEWINDVQFTRDIKNQDNSLIATAYKMNGYITDSEGNEIPCEEANANAKLIASAPELLKALQQLTERIESNWNAITSGNQNGILTALLKESKETIDKAAK